MPAGPETDFIFRAYDDLSTCRNEAGSIPWTAARVYAAEHELDADGFHLLWLIIKAMNGAEKRWASKQGSEGEAGA